MAVIWPQKDPIYGLNVAHFGIYAAPLFVHELDTVIPRSVLTGITFPVEMLKMNSTYVTCTCEIM